MDCHGTCLSVCCSFVVSHRNFVVKLYERGGNLGESFSLLLLIYPVLVRGAALLAKALNCAVGGVAFGKCAAWVCLTVGLYMPKSGQIQGLVGRIEVTDARILNAEARILLANAPFH
jgi:hypothetical protein